MSAYIRSFFRGICLSLLGAFSVCTAAGSVNLENYGTFAREDVVLLNADLDFSLPQKVKDALNEGVNLIFSVDINVDVPLEWVPDQRLVDLNVRKRLGYHALTKKYTVDDLTFGNRNSYHSLNAALTEVGRLRNVHLLDTSIAKANKNAIVRIRIELLIRELPFPVRLQAMVQPDWYLGSPWFAWKIFR